MKVTVNFKADSNEESGRIFWIYNRAPEGSVAYLEELFPEDQWKEMKLNRTNNSWIAEIEIPENVLQIDFFSTHGIIVERNDKKYQTYISSPYTRKILKNR